MESALQCEVVRQREELRQKDEEIRNLREKLKTKEDVPEVIRFTDNSTSCNWDPSKDQRLDNESIARYSRQLILPEIGVQGQLALRRSRVLVVGAGGLGCPVAVYLAAAGVGVLGIVDYDEVELSNLHRQILHTEARIGQPKSASIASACSQLNSREKCVPYHLQLDSSNALQIIQHYDIVVDATDNVATRYLLNDACVLGGKPLVSGSALRFEGQLTIYNHKGGPCYRCLYPKPPPPETVTNCSDGGVLGVVPGIIGCIQALEAIKIITGIQTSFSQRLLLFDAVEGSFRTIKLRGRQTNCVVCGDSPSITQPIDYEQFCGARATDKDGDLDILGSADRITVKKYKEMLDTRTVHTLVDVRQPVELDICKLPQPSLNIPLDSLSREKSTSELETIITNHFNQNNSPLPVILVCRRGNDSQMGVRLLQDKLKDLPVKLSDISGGLTAWAKQIDPEFPVY